MKKLDKLILQSFLGPFILTFLVAVFILLIQYMLKYFDDFIGKNLGIGVFGELMMYFSINMVPMALPLAVLVSSLMTYGRLGEHFELTAIKSAGISLVRVLMPTFVFVVLLSIGAFFFNNHVVPFANLRAYSLLYDIKQTKPALDLKEGQFYNGLPGFSIKIKKKYNDGVSMSDVVIYDHSKNKGNMTVITADSCRMYTFINDRYLMMELYDGNYYSEEEKAKAGKKKPKKGEVKINQFVRTKFDRMDHVFSLSSFDLQKTDMDLFSGNRYMKSVGKLSESIDSMQVEKKGEHFKLYRTLSSMYKLHHGGYIKPTDELVEVQMVYDSLASIKLARQDSLPPELDSARLQGPRPKIKKDSIQRVSNKGGMVANLALGGKESKLSRGEILTYTEKKRDKKIKNDSLILNEESYVEYKQFMDSLYRIESLYSEAMSKATSNAREIKQRITSSISRFGYFQKSIDAHTVEKYKKYAQAFSCLVMFLIGAPLGAIIKRGGMGFPVIIGIFFFIIFYVFTSVSDKWAKSGVVDGVYAAWIANAVLLPPGLLFLKQARKDAKLFDADFYNVLIEKISQWIKKKKA